MYYVKVILITSALLLVGTVISMRRIKRWDEAKFKRAREIIKLQEFVDKMKKLEKRGTKEGHDAMLRSSQECYARSLKQKDKK